MGGAHFGHRYINDTLPYLYFGVLLFAGTYIPTQKTISPISSKDIDICKQPDTFIAENSIPVVDDEEENEVAVEVAEETKKENFTDLWKNDTEQFQKTDDITEVSNEDLWIDDPLDDRIIKLLKKRDMNIEEIAAECDVRINELNSHLTILEVEGIILKLAGARYKYNTEN